jgi:hypothetical protein
MTTPRACLALAIFPENQILKKLMGLAPDLRPLMSEPPNVLPGSAPVAHGLGRKQIVKSGHDWEVWIAPRSSSKDYKVWYNTIEKTRCRTLTSAVAAGFSPNA